MDRGKALETKQAQTGPNPGGKKAEIPNLMQEGKEAGCNDSKTKAGIPSHSHRIENGLQSQPAHLHEMFTA